MSNKNLEGLSVAFCKHINYDIYEAGRKGSDQSPNCRGKLLY